jgi:hypothetical protein
MRLVDEGSTSSLLLREVSDWQDHSAWVSFRDRYEPFLTTWDAFWLVAVCDWTVEHTAKNLGMTHTAVYAARERVARMLCDEGKCVSDRWGAGA